MGTDTRIRYVVGLAFTADKTRVLMLEKNRPKWQAGRLNGVGGKIEPGESDLDAMVREFQEETGIGTSSDMWRLVVVYKGPDYDLLFYSTVTDAVLYAQATTDEVPRLVPVLDVQTLPVIGNLRWIVPLCDDHCIVLPIHVRE